MDYLTLKSNKGDEKMRRKTIILLLSVVITATLLTGCLKVAHKPTPKNFQMPEVTLNYVDVAHYWGWWYYSKKVEPTKGKAGASPTRPPGPTDAVG